MYGNEYRKDRYLLLKALGRQKIFQLNPRFSFLKNLMVEIQSLLGLGKITVYPLL